MASLFQTGDGRRVALCRSEILLNASSDDSRIPVRFGAGYNHQLEHDRTIAGRRIEGPGANRMAKTVSRRELLTAGLAAASTGPSQSKIGNQKSEMPWTIRTFPAGAGS